MYFSKFNEIKSGPSIRTTEDIDLMVYENGIEQSVELNENYTVLYEERYNCIQHNCIKE